MECNCSKKRMANGLQSIGKEQLEIILREDEKAEIVCNFCGKRYFFSKNELKELLEELK